METLIEKINHTIAIWIKALDEYNYTQLCAKPAPNSWSLGQLYIHLVQDTNYYLEQIRISVSTNKNGMEEMSPFGKTLFLNNGFPDELIEGAPSNAHIEQPASKEQLINSLVQLRDEITSVALQASQTFFIGKTKHPGLNYFSAAEWLQLAEMHFRHHLRQKKRIDIF